MRKKEGIREEGKRLEKERGKEDKKYPTMPHVIFSYYRVRKTGRKGQAFSANIDYIQQDGMPSCRRCGARDAIFYDHYERKAKLSSIDGKTYDVKIRAKRYRCPHCGHLFREPIRGLKPHKRMSENFKDSVAEKYLDGVTNKRISERLRVSQSTVERIIHEKFEALVKEKLNYECPTILGIDEHTIHKGYKFATTIADLSHHRIYDIIKGKKHSDIEGALMSYKGREKVKVVCMDLSSGYRSIVRRCFPRAKIVADRFHVIRLVLHHFMEFCKSAQEEVKWKRSLTYPLRKRKERLKPHERERLKNFFKENPAIELAYEFKEKLCELLNKKSQTAKQCKNNIRKLKGMMKVMRYEAPTEFGKLAETISEWFAPIIRMWRFTKNNGITEGFHRKMKLIQRLAYGYKNFENYRLRVLVQCGVFH